jgi:hypothetical protein
MNRQAYLRERLQEITLNNIEENSSEEEIVKCFLKVGCYVDDMRRRRSN